MTITRDWSAWYNRMPGIHDPNLHVTGVCELTSGSQSARLDPRPAGYVDEPGVVTFALIVETPELGDDRMKEVTVTWVGDVGSDINTVRIRTPDENVVSVDVTIAV
jgi:hypothetical protein